MNKYKKNKKHSFSDSTKIYHRYFKKSGFYKFVIETSLKLIVIIAIIVAVIQLFSYFNIDLVNRFQNFANKVPDYLVFTIFFISETILGLIPPDLFMVWGRKFEHIFLIITVLALISYIAGIIAYFIGIQIMKNQRISNYVQNKYKKTIEFLKRWGGFFVLLAGLFPIPYSLATMMAGMVNYRFYRLALFGLSRLARFYLYAAVIFEFV